MDLNNKQDLLGLIAESDFQGFNKKGDMVAFSMLENLSAENAERIFHQVKKGMTDWLNGLGQNVEITALELYKAGLSLVELNTTEEVLHFNWIIGQLYAECRLKLEALKNMEAQQFIAPEEGSPLEIAVQLDKAMGVVSDLVQQIPVSVFWDSTQWQAHYKTAIYNIRNLIKQLY